MGDGVPYPFYLIYLLSSVGANLIRPLRHIVPKNLCIAMPEISNMHFTYSLCAAKRRPREDRPLNAHRALS